MDRTATTGLRHCLRLRQSIQTSRLSSRSSKLHTSAACSQSKTIHHPSLARPQPFPSFIRRSYSSSSESTIQGTIGLGASGVASEAARAAEALQAPDHLDEAERRIWDKLNTELQPEKLSVQDVSGGCGSMYAIDVVSRQFKGMNMLKQQRLVNKVLGEEIKGWHGVQLSTKAP
ncbi:Altered inheritance of mitochondria 1 protein [Rutstroemia sp. NJR-2017a BVV2]|nr:Altered inheritance of mitochondria 1 protein [Rutstroemia sp. NJR-2017a BVV2]